MCTHEENNFDKQKQQQKKKKKKKKKKIRTIMTNLFPFNVY